MYELIGTPHGIMAHILLCVQMKKVMLCYAINAEHGVGSLFHFSQEL